MGKINKKKFAKEVEQNKSEDEFETASEDELESNKKRKADGDSDDEPLSPTKKSKKSSKKTPAKSNGKDEKSKKKLHSKYDSEEDGEEQSENGDDGLEENGEEEFEVKELIDHKVEGGKSFYLVRWKGYTKDDDTWEPEDSLSCKDLIEKYKKKMGNDKSKKVDKKSPKAKGKQSLPADPSKQWEVDKIIDYAEEKGVTLYRIRWKGYSAKNDTWEPRDNLFCDDLIEKFEKRMKTLENITFKELREDPKKTRRLVNETALRTDITNRVSRSSKRSATKKRVYYGDSDE